MQRRVSEQRSVYKGYEGEYRRGYTETTMVWIKGNGEEKTNERCVELAKHCIGIDRKKPYTRHGKKFYRPYRNFYATGKNFENWETMKQVGYADRDSVKNQHGSYTYWLTRAGLDWIGEKLGVRIYDEEE